MTATLSRFSVHFVEPVRHVTVWRHVDGSYTFRTDEQAMGRAEPEQVAAELRKLARYVDRSPWHDLIDLYRVIVRARTGQRIGRTG